MTCAACGSPLKENQGFCANCGKPQKVGTPPKSSTPIRSTSSRGAVVHEPPDPGPMPKTNQPIWAEKSSAYPGEPPSKILNAPGPAIDIPRPNPVPFQKEGREFVKLLGPLFLMVLVIGFGILMKGFGSGKLDEIMIKKGKAACEDKAVTTLLEYYQKHYNQNPKIHFDSSPIAAVLKSEEEAVEISGNLGLSYVEVLNGQNRYQTANTDFFCRAQRKPDQGKTKWEVTKITFGAITTCHQSGRC